MGCLTRSETFHIIPLCLITPPTYKPTHNSWWSCISLGLISRILSMVHTKCCYVWLNNNSPIPWGIILSVSRSWIERRSFITWWSLIALKAGTNALPSSVSRKHTSLSRDAKYALVCVRTSFQLPMQSGCRWTYAQTFSKLYTSTSICITNNPWEVTTWLISSTLQKRTDKLVCSKH